MEVKIKDLLEIYEKEVSKNTKNKRKVYGFEKYKIINLVNIKKILEQESYKISHYNIFYIYEPKLRIIMSLDIEDRVVDHYAAKYILMKKLNKYLDIRNVASRKNMGIDYGLKLVKKYIEENKKYNSIFVLKIDIRKYFYNIDHNVLKEMLISKLDENEYKLICTFIDSTNEDYVNEAIANIKDKLLCIAKTDKQRQEIIDIPYYHKKKGLTIGNVCSQILSIFYLSEIDHYIIHDLKCKYMVRYCDDLIIIHHNKEYLKIVLKQIEQRLKKNKLEINKKKSFVVNIKKGFIFCGNYIKLDGKKTIMYKCQKTRIRMKRNIRKKERMYKKGLITFRYYFSSINSYKKNEYNRSLK